MGNFDHPASILVTWLAAFADRFGAPVYDERDVVVIFDRLPARVAGSQNPRRIDHALGS